jgi:putative membrane protein
MTRLKFLVTALGLAGAALLALLVARQGFREVGALLASAGGGLLVVAAWHVVPMLVDVLGWRALFPPADRPSFLRLWQWRWIGESVNALLPAAQIGGDVVRARLASWRGVPLPLAAATVVAEITACVFSQAAFTLLGIGLLIWKASAFERLHSLLTGGLVALAAGTGFYFVQRAGLFRLMAALLTRLSHSPVWQGIIANTHALDRELQGLYARRRQVGVSLGWTFVSWIVGAGEAWLGLRVLGWPVGLVEALILESTGQAVRSAFFLVPGALGVQEGGFLAVGAWLGVPADTALALALVKRFRELTLGLPGLAAWQWQEARRLRRLAMRPAGELIVTDP